ncbi:MAG: molybdenum ABC transporter ATP-binding protein, partial [Bauldia sp.]|nr:molybdenum ABC transporter ATP-binding protein [Bauldia sp.]
MADSPSEPGLRVRLSQVAPIAIEVGFSVAPGTMLALVGPSGSGKTTTLRAIAGFHRPDAGYVANDGEVWLDTASGIDVPARRRRVGFVFQSYALFPHLTVRQNVVEAMRDRPVAARPEAAGSLLARVHLAGLEDRKPDELSGGQQQRVAIARALARRPHVLLLDEPFSAVDRKTRRRLQAEMAELRGLLSMPVVLVTHDIDDVARLADTVVLLADGKVSASGPVADVFARLDLGHLIDRETAGAIIHARVIAHDAASGTTRLDHPAGKIFHPLLHAEPGAVVRLRVRARDVALAVGEPGLLSIRNRLHGSVAEIGESDGYAVDVRIDIGGEALIARITRDAAMALDLKVGQPVVALIKSTAFDRLDD